MSFQDLEAGRGPSLDRSALALTPQSGEDAAFLKLQSSLSLQAFKINSNVHTIMKYVDELGTAKDNARLRKGLHDLTETTIAMVKRSSEDLKKLSVLQRRLPHQKVVFQKTSHDVQMSLLGYQRAQELSARSQRTAVQWVKKFAVEGDHSAPSGPHRDQQIQVKLSSHELAYQESLIQERETEIQEIESGIHDIVRIIQEVGTLVDRQGEMIDTIGMNISSVVVDTGSAEEELTTAYDYQRKAGRTSICLLLIFAVVAVVVLLAILP